MKRVLFILDGASDEPSAASGNRTPLEAARTPNLDFLARKGSLFRLRTAFPGFPVESLACIMGLLGYDPARHYPYGRASVEALAGGIPLGENDLALRCNIVGVSGDGATLLDSTAGMIDDAPARCVLGRAVPPCGAWELHPGQSYRNLLIIRNARQGALHICRELVCAPPHMHLGENIRDLLPSGTTPRARELALRLSRFLLDTFDRSGVMLWVWSPSVVPSLPNFYERYGLRACVVAGLDFMRGLGMACGMESAVTPGTTGSMDTEYAAKARAAIKAVRSHDCVLVHVNAPDEAAHQRDSRAKTAAIERIDRDVVAPVLRFLRGAYADAFAVAVCVDHMTRCGDGKHVGEPTPCLVCYEGQEGGYEGRTEHPIPEKDAPHGLRLTERATSAAPLVSALRFAEEFFSGTLIIQAEGR